jgi:hypothetical protein
MIALVTRKIRDYLKTFTSASDDRASAGEKLENQSDHSQYQEDMDKSTQGVAAHNSK